MFFTAEKQQETILNLSWIHYLKQKNSNNGTQTIIVLTNLEKKLKKQS